MSEVAEKIRLTDLANPVLTDMQVGALAWSQANPVTLTPDAVLAAAQQATGLSDFGPDDFRERLAVWMHAGDNDTELSAAGRGTLFSEAVRLPAPLRA